MSIRKGEPWGFVDRAPDDLERVADDSALFRLVNQCRRSGTPLPAVAPAAGDLLRSLGGSGDVERLSGPMAILPVDVVRIEVEGDRAWFVSHLISRRSWWRGRLVGVMNAQYLGAWDVAPRAHPGDGRVDLVIVDASMPPRERLRARQRVVHGLHLPHPAIDVRQHRSTTIAFEPRAHIWLDGVRWRRAEEATVTVEPDALTVCI
jgi:hypothetical protein